MEKRFPRTLPWAAAMLSVALFASPVFAAVDPVIAFDQGVDLSAVTQQVRERADELEADVGACGAFRATRDCAIIKFTHGQGEISSPVVLKSEIFKKVCQRHNGREYCHDELERTVEKPVIVALTGERSMLPWEMDAFGVCLQGDNLKADVIEASHKYKVRHRSDEEGNHVIEAHAKKKLRTEPDPTGIEMAGFRYDAGSAHFVLTLKDKWAEYYEGDLTEIKFALKRDVPRWRDSTVIRKEIRLDPAASYAVRFADYPRDLREEIMSGERYYVEWSFKRKGKVSKGSRQDGGKSSRVLAR